MPTKKKASKKKQSKGLTVKTFKGGLDQKRMKKGTGGQGMRVILKDQTIPVQFLTDPDNPDGFVEFEIHNFQEDGRWEYVPCTGDDCPLCEDESEQRSRTRYRFCAVVYNLAEKRVQVLEGPKDMAGRIYYRYERNPSKFRKRAFDITKFPTQPVTYGVDIAEDATPKNPKGMELIDLGEYLQGELKRYYGDDLEAAKTSASALDDDDWDEDELDDLDDEDEEDLDDDEDEDDWDDDEDEDDEEDDEPAPPKKTKKKPAAKSSKSSPARRRRR